MNVRCWTLGLLGLVLGLASCTHCGNFSSDWSCDTNSGSGGGVVQCGSPSWYWSNGKYLRWMDDLVTRRSAERCAMRTYQSRLEKGSSRSDDYRCGYIQAYVDIAFGSRGVIPAVPPEKYWKAHNRSPRGYARVDQWFAGYRDGVCDAQARGREDYLFVPTSAGLIDHSLHEAHSVQGVIPWEFQDGHIPAQMPQHSGQGATPWEFQDERGGPHEMPLWQQ